MSKEFRWVLVWLFGGTIAFVLSMSMLGGIIIDNQWVPSDQDAFYHARRILDTASNPAHFYEFDKKIHAPEGSLLVWPWAYDYLMGQGVRFIKHFASVKESFKILAYFPTVWIYVNAALVLSIATVLNFSGFGRILTILCFALLPGTVFLYRPGNVDHHFIEATFSLATLLFGLLAFKDPKSYFKAILLGILLGIAPAFQCGLFILQIPVLLGFISKWFSKGKLAGRQTRMLGFALFASNLFMLIFSQPFLEGQFAFYYYAWFHFYVALISMTILWYMTYVSFSYKKLLLLIALCLGVGLPIIKQLSFGTEFIFNKVPELQGTGEMQSPWEKWHDFTILLFSFPVFLLIFFVESIRAKKPYLRFCAIYLVFVGILMSMQLRFGSYGIIALFLPLIFLFEKYVNTLNAKWKLFARFLFAILLLACFFETARRIKTSFRLGFGQYISNPNQRVTPVIGGEISYEYMFSVFSPLNKICQDDPGIILADPHFGHYLRYHTDCSVIANRMLITPQHFQKAARVQELFSGSIEDFLKNPEKVKYILVSLRGEWGAKDNTTNTTNASDSNNDAELPPLILTQPTNEEALFTVLLYDEAEAWSEHFELLKEHTVRFGGKLGDIRWLRVFKVKYPAQGN